MLKPLFILIDADLADLLHAFTYFFDFSLGLLVSPHVVSWPLRYHRIPKPKKCKWYGSSKQGVIKTACELNILNGMSPTKFDPEGTLRLNEAVKIACVIHALYTGQADPLQPGTGKHWAAPYLAYAEANGILQKDEFTNYDRPATRSEMAHIFAKSLPEDGLKKINTILSINDVEREDLSPIQYAADIFKLYRAGVLAGEPKTHDFRPDSTITRAETAAIVARLALPETREKFDNFLHRGFYTDIPGFTLTNTRTGKTLSPGQRPYEELTAFVEGFTVIEQEKYDLYGAQNSVITKVTNTYDKDNLCISYCIDKENPRCVFIGWISTNSPDYVNQRGIRVGCSEAELKEKYPETGDSALCYYPPEPTHSDFSTFYISITHSSTFEVHATYSMSAEHNGSVSDMSFFAY